MRPGVTALVTVIGVVLFNASPAAAQPEPADDPYYQQEQPPPPPTVTPQPAPPPPRHYDPRAAKRYRKAQERQAHRYLMDTNPEYQAARSRRTTGIVLTSLGGVSFLVGAVAGMVYGICKGLDGGSDCTSAAWWTLGGLGVGTAGLAVGLTMLVSGHRRMKAIRARALYHGGLWPDVNVAMGRRGGRLGLAWRF